MKNDMDKLKGTLYSQEIINSMRLGIVPVRKIHYLTVGRDDMIEEMRGCFRDVSEGKGRSLIIEGSFGSGKSHMLNYARYLALRKKFVVSSVVIDQTVSFKKMDRVFNIILNNIEFSDFPGITGLDRFLQELARSEKRKDLLEWTEDTGGASALERKFKACIKAYILLLRKPEFFETGEMVMRWILGEKIPGPVIRRIIHEHVREARDITAFSHGSDDTIDLIKTVAGMMKATGYNGWLILFDECENLIYLGNKNRKTLEKIFLNMDRMVKGIPHIFCLMSLTPGTLDEVLDKLRKALEIDERISIPEFMRPASRKRYLRDLRQLTFDDYMKLSDSIADFYKEAYPEAEKILNEQHKEYLASFFQSANNLPTREVIKTVIEFLDYSSFYPEEMEEILRNGISITSDEISNELTLRSGEIIEHDLFGTCEVLNVKPEYYADGRKRHLIEVKILNTREIKSFYQDFARFRKIIIKSE